MPERRYGMIQYHPGAGITHHRTYPLPHGRTVTMYRTVAAGGFILAEGAAPQTPGGIPGQGRTVITQLSVPLFMTTVKGYHRSYGTYFSVCFFHDFRLPGKVFPGAVF